MLLSLGTLPKFCGVGVGQEIGVHHPELRCGVEAPSCELAVGAWTWCRVHAIEECVRILLLDRYGYENGPKWGVPKYKEKMRNVSNWDKWLILWWNVVELHNMHFFLSMALFLEFELCRLDKSLELFEMFIWDWVEMHLLTHTRSRYRFLFWSKPYQIRKHWVLLLTQNYLFWVT